MSRIFTDLARKFVGSETGHGLTGYLFSHRAHRVLREKQKNSVISAGSARKRVTVDN
jgi:hypothetical protein